MKQEYEDIVKNEVQRAISADEEAISKLCANYIDNIKAYTQKERVKNRYTGQDDIGIGKNGMPQRLVILFTYNGATPETWFPTTTGAGYTMPSSIAPLAPHKNDIVVFDGIDNKIHKTDAFREPAITCGHIIKQMNIMTGVPLSAPNSAPSVATTRWRTLPSVRTDSTICRYSCLRRRAPDR